MLFLNFYRYNDDAGFIQSDVIVFQGRRFSPAPERSTNTGGNEASYVTPDLGVMHKPGRNLLGDVKKSFPKDEEYWQEDFKQLMSYDDDLTGWPCPAERVPLHDVVLLIHQSRAVVACEYYREKGNEGAIRFVRPFAIISFNRSVERRPYLHFEKRVGNLSDEVLNERLHRGIPVPMDFQIDHYSSIKPYDAQPPLSYLAFLIWEHVVTPRASEDIRFRFLRRNQKIEINLRVDEIAKELSEGFSLHTLSQEHPERQPQVPQRAWCVWACAAMSIASMARWTDPASKEEITIYFKKLENVLDHMAEACKQREQSEAQLSLF